MKRWVMCGAVVVAALGLSVVVIIWATPEPDPVEQYRTKLLNESFKVGREARKALRESKREREELKRSLERADKVIEKFKSREP